MKVLLYADFRSPHSRGWHQGLLAAGLEVFALSSEAVSDYDAEGPSDRMSRNRQQFLDETRGREPNLKEKLLIRASNLQIAHTVMNLARIRSRRRQLRKVIKQFNPDVIHGLRIPYEGLTVLGLDTAIPIVVSTWGSDFVPMAKSDPLLSVWMKLALKKASGLQTDSLLDQQRAVGFGVLHDAPFMYAAGNFGVDNDFFFVEQEHAPGVVVYPRKAKANSNYMGFVAAAAKLSKTAGAKFVGVGLVAAESQIVQEFGPEILETVQLTGDLDRSEMAALMRSADVVVSPTFWDGTPVTIIEAVASGARVVAGELPELRRLKEEGLAIELIDAASTDAIASAVEAALLTPNPHAIAQTLPPQFDREKNAIRVVSFYEEVRRHRGQSSSTRAIAG